MSIVPLESLDGSHIYTYWNVTGNQPVNGCYTTLLFDFVRSSIQNQTGANITVMMLGLGGGVLAARLARVGVSTVAIDLSVHVITTYKTQFQPMTAKWAPTVYDLVKVVYGNAFSAATSKDKDIPVKGRVVVVDLPQCYKEASTRCVALIRRLAERARIVVVHVWKAAESIFLWRVRNVSGNIVLTGPDTFVWATYLHTE